ncbi:outer membrane protein [Sphingomonas sanguinis]|uniref:outer membrane protein n=1 Tax=Sphingomonas sanguinis TaxID=33051 RepID=UPI00214CB4B7|nr:outer membrane beta-barrel protein [Sphingomonas sanguinis]
MRMRIIPSVLVALLPVMAIASPAAAQDAAQGGLRVGAIGGLDILRSGSTERSGIDGDDQSAEGFLYGVEVGYDLPLGGVVLGVEGEWTDSTGKAKADRRDPNLFGYGEVKAGRDLYVGGRAGFAVAPSTLAYVKGGYTNAHLDTVLGNGSVSDRERFRLNGWRIGAGLQQSIGTNTYAKLEYRYSNYEQADYRFVDGGSTDRFDVDTDRHQIVAGVGVRF